MFTELSNQLNEVKIFLNFAESDLQNLQEIFTEANKLQDDLIAALHPFLDHMESSVGISLQDKRDEITSLINHQVFFSFFDDTFADELLHKMKDEVDASRNLALPSYYLNGIRFYLYQSILDLAFILYSNDQKKLQAMIASLTKAFIIINHLELSIMLSYEYEEKILREKLLEELLTPCLEIWEDVLLLPLIGNVTSDRAKKAMETVLLAASSRPTKVVIIDITGVPLMDTMVANYLIRTVNSLKLIGVESILTGIGPAIAQTVVSLGIDLTFVPTKRTLSEGLKYAINKIKAKAQDEGNVT